MGYPKGPLFEEWIVPADGADQIGVYLTHDGLVFMCAPDVDTPCFKPELAEKVCEAIMRAAAKSRVTS